MIYLDHAATAPVRREVLEAMWPYWTQYFANPASHHEPGISAAAGLDAARKQVAYKLGAKPSEIVFTSGGTEGANTAVKGIARANPRGKHLIVSAIEHPAVLESARALVGEGFELTILTPEPDGRITPANLRQHIHPDTTLVSVQLANNEIGTIQPIAELATVAREFDVPMHTDAVQAAVWLDIDVTKLGVQALSLAGHKLGTPRGIGVLWLKRGLDVEPLLHGGNQQPGRRSGTEDVAGAVGIATALRLVEHDLASVNTLRDHLIAGILNAVPGARLTGSAAHRLPGHASFVFTETDGRSGESILVDLEQRGIVCSSGSACAAGDDEPSPVLLALGIEPHIAQTSVRMTFGTDFTIAEADTVIAEMARIFH
ncbi:MAG: cysteine desulfurase [Aeromicrobium sp.]|nr:MAG: cysteine desulfurase [Aeromicrobium sp.]